jgi:tetratricopeptide (TPR) repeat protein
LALGRNEEALTTINKAIHLNPITPMYYLMAQGIAYQNTGQYEEAIAAYKKALLLNPDYFLAHIGLAMSYSLTGQEEQAHAEAKEVLRISPKFSVDGWAKTGLGGYKRDQKDIYINALRKAGLK